MRAADVFATVCDRGSAFVLRATPTAMDMDLAGDSPAPQVGGGREKIPVVVDVCLRPTSTARREDVRGAILTYIEDVGSLRYSAEPLELPSADEDPYIHAHVESACISDLGQYTLDRL